MGGEIGPLLAERLPRVPWYVQRNLLALLARLKTLPAGFDARVYAEHPEVTVRFQALSVMARQPKGREEAIHLALADTDPAGGAARARRGGRWPAAPGRHAADGPHQQRGASGGTPAARDQAAGAGADARHARLAARAGADQADALPRTAPHARSRRRCSRRSRCWPRKWRQHPQAAYALKLAEESGDPELAAAAGGTGGRVSATGFLISLGQCLATMNLYADGHPARERALDNSYERLVRLLEGQERFDVSFVGTETVVGDRALTRHRRLGLGPAPRRRRGGAHRDRRRGHQRRVCPVRR